MNAPVARELCGGRAGTPCAICGRAAHLRGFDSKAAMELACALFDIDHAELTGPVQNARLVEGRAFAVWVLRTLGRPLSYKRIGRAMGGREHSTAMNLHLKAIDLRMRNADFAANCLAVRRAFYELRRGAHACH